MFNSTLAAEKNSKKLKKSAKRISKKSAKKSVKKVIRLAPKGLHLISPLRLAVIDLGTNSVRLDIYRVSLKGVTRLYRGKIMIRLGDGVFKTGRLTSQGIERGLRAFVRFRTLIRDYHVDEVIAFGTSALRTAQNTKQFIDRVYEKTSIPIKVISGVEEGRLIARGILESYDLPKGAYALVDIGGGSAEVSIGRGQKILLGHSFPLGANRLQQMYFKEIPPRFKKGELYPVLALRQHLKEILYPLTQLRPKINVTHVIGSSGTIRTVARILKKIGRNDRPVYRSDISALVSEMQMMTREQLKRVPGLEPKRIDLILSGCILLEEIMMALGVRTLETTDLALRDGILVEAVSRYR